MLHSENAGLETEKWPGKKHGRGLTSVKCDQSGSKVFSSQKEPVFARATIWAFPRDFTSFFPFPFFSLSTVVNSGFKGCILSILEKDKEVAR